MFDTIHILNMIHATNPNRKGRIEEGDTVVVRIISKDGVYKCFSTVL